MIISTRDLTKTYRVGVEHIHALRGVDIDIEPNEMVAIMGSSGSGKSTFMNIIGCLDQQSSGRYYLNGRDTVRMGASELAHVRNEEIGFVFQSFELLPRMTAQRNVEMPLIYSKKSFFGRRRRARRALERVGLADRVSHRPNQLSGGQKQRVAVARAILSNPAILLADEPTGNLDSSTTADIMSLFAQLHDEGQTIIIVTHENEVAAHCQRVIRLRDGEVDTDLPIHRDPAGRHLQSVSEEGGKSSSPAPPADPASLAPLRTEAEPC